jgi:hypothetical protein
MTTGAHSSHVSLDRDPGSFDLPPNEVERRRRLWWDLYGHDAWNVGNPLSSARTNTNTIAVDEMEPPSRTFVPIL